MTHSDQLSQAIKGAAEVRAWGLREAHPRPRVGERDDGGAGRTFQIQDRWGNGGSEGNRPLRAATARG